MSVDYPPQIETPGETAAWNAGVRQGQRFERARIRALIEERLEAEDSWVDPVLRVDLVRIADSE